MIRAALLQKIFLPVVELPLDVCRIISVMAAHSFKADCVRMTRENWKRRCVVEEEIALTRAIKRIRHAVSEGVNCTEYEYTDFEKNYAPTEFDTGDDILAPAGFVLWEGNGNLQIGWSLKK